MKEVKPVNAELVMNAFEEYAQHFIQTKKFDMKEFLNFIEPKFSAAGYRTAPKIGDELNVLIIHDAGIGDFVLQSGAIREIRRLYPAAHITLAVNGGSVPLAESCPYVNEIICLEPSQNGFDRMYMLCAKTARKIFQRRIDICYAYIHRAWTPFLMYMSGARIRITHKVKDIDDAFLMSQKNSILKSLEFLATDFVPMFIYGQHMVDVFFSPLDFTLKLPVENRELEIWYTALDKTNAKNILAQATRPVYAISMGGAEMMKHYPPENYAKLVEMILAEDSTATFVILGGHEDLKSAQILKENLDEKIFTEHIIDLTDKINFRQCAAIISFCKMYIGNDTGTMHIATAAKCPVLEPNCFAKDLPMNKFDYVRFFSPYKVPAVVVQPLQALDGCQITTPYDSMGCRVNKPHCITQITPEILFDGYHLLKEKISTKDFSTSYIS